MAACNERSRAVFLDKDGTVIEDVPYNVDPALMQLAPGVLRGLRMLQTAGYQLVIISNQSGVALGRFPESALHGVEQQLRRLLSAADVVLSGFYYCPHHPEGQVAGYACRCECRKPQPGLIRRAADELEIEVSLSWMVGDILDDVQAGRRAGCRTILVNRGNETLWKWSAERTPHFTVSTVLDAARIIVQQDAQTKEAGVAGEVTR